MADRRLPPPTKRGFTLTELAIVLGIIGLILGAIWVAAARVYANQKAEKAAGQVLQILSGYRSLYTQHGVDTPDWTDITCMGVNGGFFPADMLQSGTACVPNGYNTYPSPPWGSASAGQYVQVWSHQSWQGIIIQYTNIPQAACIQLASAISSSSNLIYMLINATAFNVSPPAGTAGSPTSAQINTACVAGNTNVVQVLFPAR